MPIIAMLVAGDAMRLSPVCRTFKQRGPRQTHAALLQCACHLSAGMAGGLRAAGPKADIALVTADEPCVAAGVFTLNVMCAAPVTYCKQVLAKGQPVKAVSRVPQRAQKGDSSWLPCLEAPFAVVRQAYKCPGKQATCPCGDVPEAGAVIAKILPCT